MEITIPLYKYIYTIAHIIQKQNTEIIYCNTDPFTILLLQILLQFSKSNVFSKFYDILWKMEYFLNWTVTVIWSLSHLKNQLNFTNNTMWLGCFAWNCIEFYKNVQNTIYLSQPLIKWFHNTDSGLRLVWTCKRVLECVWGFSKMSPKLKGSRQSCKDLGPD